MASLPRGSCPACGADVALRKGELVREHPDRRQPYPAPTCEGSGRLNVCDCAPCLDRRSRFGYAGPTPSYIAAHPGLASGD